jgi:hypothetical protein
MSKVKIQGNASGTGVLTVTAPNTSTDRTITLPDATGTLIADNGSGKVGIGTSSPDGTAHIHTASAGSVTANADADDLVVENSGHTGINILSPDASRSAIQLGHTSDNLKMQIRHDGATSLTQIISDDELTFNVNGGAERMRIQSDGSLLVGTTDGGSSGAGDIVASAIFLGGNQAANELDDYEEGTWTPSLSSSDNRSGTWSNTIGMYTKIGNIVNLYFGITGSNMYFTSERGYQYITGVPFNAANPTHYNTYSGTWSGDAVDKSAGGHVYLNGSSIYMHSANSNPSTVGCSGIGCHITYRTNS